MKTKTIVNPFSGKLQKISHLPQLNYDPNSPRAGDAWILKRDITVSEELVSGSPVGLLLTLTQDRMESTSSIIPEGSPLGLTLVFTQAEDIGISLGTSYELSYRTQDSTTIRCMMQVDDEFIDPGTIPPPILPVAGNPYGLLLVWTIPPEVIVVPPVAQGTPMGILVSITREI